MRFKLLLGRWGKIGSNLENLGWQGHCSRPLLLNPCPIQHFGKPKGLNEHRGCYLNLGAAGKAQRHRGAEPAFFEHPPAHSPRDAGEKKKGWKQGHRSD